jgi:hypothetical protein
VPDSPLQVKMRVKEHFTRCNDFCEVTVKFARETHMLNLKEHASHGAAAHLERCAVIAPLISLHTAPVMFVLKVVYQQVDIVDMLDRVQS